MVCQHLYQTISKTLIHFEPTQKLINNANMSAKSLGTLAMIYATDELQNPLPHKTILYKGDMNNPAV